MRASDQLFDLLAAEYDEHFAVPHRRAYDDLAWEVLVANLPTAPARLLDVGCGVGRWAARLIEAGYTMTGVEPSPEMAAAFHQRVVPRGATLLKCRVEHADFRPNSFDGAFAMGSLQYSDDITESVSRIAGWLKPGAPLFVLVDSALALALELIYRGDLDQAIERVASRRGLWTQHGINASHHLFDREKLVKAFADAGLRGVECRGLLVGASALGRAGLLEALQADYEGQLDRERKLSKVEALTDCGKQLLVFGYR